MTAHKHAALMLQYAQDAEETDTPWERWEVNTDGDTWVELIKNPSWLEDRKYRRKPQVIRVGRHEFPRPITFVPQKDTIYWVIRLQFKGYAPNELVWSDDETDLALLESRVIHLSRESAQAHADVLNAICRGDVE